MENIITKLHLKMPSTKCQQFCKQTREHIWWSACQKQVSMTGTSNYTPQYLWGVIISPCPQYLLLAQHFWFIGCVAKLLYQAWSGNGPLTRYAKMQVAHAPGMPGTFSPPPRVSDPDMHHGTCVTHVPWCMPGSLTSGFLWSRWRGKRSRHSRRMRNSQFYGKRPMIYHTPTKDSMCRVAEHCMHLHACMFR